MENLEDIKVGDKVILYRKFQSNIVSKVERLTKNYVIVEGRKFRKKDGLEPGIAVFYSSSIGRATEEMIAKIEEENKRDLLIRKISRYPFSKLSTDELEKVYDFINK